MHLFFSLAALAVALAIPPPPPASIAPHPRLVLTPARIAAINAAAASGAPDAASFISLLKQHADWALTQPVVPHGVPGASGILMHVRYALDLLLTSAAAHLFRAERNSTRYRDRAVLEALSLCVNWTDWNTEQHALDTGEALLAVGLAYDWLFTDLSPAERLQISGGLVTRGLTPYRAFIPDRKVFWWVNNSINWNCVCTSGGVTAVLALYGDAAAPPWAWAEVFAPLLSGVAPCVAAYHEDSSWSEGPAYWGYASKYNVWLFSALQSVFGDTAGLAQLPGVPLAARFPIYSAGANAILGTAEQANWADAGTSQDWSPFASWWGGASGFNDRAAVYYARLGTRLLGPKSLTAFAWGGFVEALAFYDPEGVEADLLALPTAHFYDYIQVASWRSPWKAAQNNFLHIKGGNSAWNHNHLDLGSFVYDFNGVRYAEDMGSDNYDLPGYFGPQRWDYYRLNTRGHNALMFGNASQRIAAAPITMFNATFSPAVAGTISLDGFAIVNLTAAYDLSAPLQSYRRGFISVSASAAVIVVEEFVYNGGGAPQPANLTFQLHTRAAAAQLTRTSVSLGPVGSGAQLAIIGAPGCFEGWRFTDLAQVLPDPPFDSARGYTRVDAVFSAPVAAGLARLAFALGDGPIVDALALGRPAVRPMSEWAASGPLDFS